MRCHANVTQHIEMQIQNTLHATTGSQCNATDDTLGQALKTVTVL